MGVMGSWRWRGFEEIMARDVVGSVWNGDGGCGMGSDAGVAG